MRTIFFAAVGMALFCGLNLLEMAHEGEEMTPGTLFFEFTETALIFSAVAATAFMAIESQKTKRDQALLISKVERAQFDGTQWRTVAENYVAGLGKAISEQFDAWNFTQSEADIAMLMLKGFSHKEVAGLRDTSEATVRQQACSIYSKSGQKNHRELSAYFLEDLTPSLKEPADLAGTGAVQLSTHKTS